MTVSVQVWDLPLRLFHWLLAAAVAGAIITGEIGGGLMDWHGRIGVLILGLLVFRVIWGFAGTPHARFGSFIPTPAKIAAYRKGQWQGHGHNPFGALAVFALLGILAALVGLGLFANDDIAFHGPLFELVDKSASDSLTGWHARIFNILAVLIGLHLAAIVFYVRVKKQNLVIPMLTGRKIVPKDQPVQAARLSVLRSVAVLAIAVAAAWTVGSGVLLPHPPPAAVAPAAATPSW
ncbi:MAG TPA: cytochrome b/b6 domain-containing protein [Gallionella sp.]|nr:cytochrome b/b6 domain-containing protein [Gallionella sp.]